MRWYREIRLEVGAMITIAGVILSLLAIGNFLVAPSCSTPPDFFCDLVRNKVGPWNIWVLVVGPILLLAGIVYLGDTVKKQREFSKLIDTDSKAKFVQNQDRIEYLAWLLSSRFERRVEEKKREFKIS